MIYVNLFALASRWLGENDRREVIFSTSRLENMEFRVLEVDESKTLRLVVTRSSGGWLWWKQRPEMVITISQVSHVSYDQEIIWRQELTVSESGEADGHVHLVNYVRAHGYMVGPLSDTAPLRISTALAEDYIDLINSV
jgi:hypothetical protein